MDHKGTETLSKSNMICEYYIYICQVYFSSIILVPHVGYLSSLKVHHGALKAVKSTFSSLSAKTVRNRGGWRKIKDMDRMWGWKD